MLRMFVHAGWDFGLGASPVVGLVCGLTVLTGMVVWLVAILPRVPPGRAKLVVAAGKALLAGYALAVGSIMAAAMLEGGALFRIGL